MSRPSGAGKSRLAREALAIATALAGAESAGAQDQFGAEVLCLQTAAQFGDHSRAARLRELESLVEGPRVGLTWRLAELAAISEAFEDMGDLVAAADTAAHAASAYHRNDLRGSALACASRADSPAE